jgi:hypothetical protein
MADCDVGNLSGAFCLSAQTTLATGKIVAVRQCLLIPEEVVNNDEGRDRERIRK